MNGSWGRIALDGTEWHHDLRPDPRADRVALDDRRMGLRGTQGGRSGGVPHPQDRARFTLLLGTAVGQAVGPPPLQAEGPPPLPASGGHRAC